MHVYGVHAQYANMRKCSMSTSFFDAAAGYSFDININSFLRRPKRKREDK